MNDFDFPGSAAGEPAAPGRAKFFALGFLCGVALCLAIFGFLVLSAREGKKATEGLNRDISEADEHLKESRRLLNKKP